MRGATLRRTRLLRCSWCAAAARAACVMHPGGRRSEGKTGRHSGGGLTPDPPCVEQLNNS
eukprot:scaffold30427_cov139-Isochrysis_galbana.AAC.5